MNTTANTQKIGYEYLKPSSYTSHPLVRKQAYCQSSFRKPQSSSEAGGKPSGRQ